VLVFATYRYWALLSETKAVVVKLDFLRLRVDSYSERWAALHSHAADYILSLDGGGVQECRSMTRLLNQVNHLVFEAQYLTCYRDRRYIAQAAALLNYEYASISWSYRNDTVKDFPDSNWEQQCENLIQSIGAQVLNASLACKEIHLPRMRKKTPSTVFELSRIGIQAAIDRVRFREAPVRSLLTKTTNLS
jgi:hypothetical protein